MSKENLSGLLDAMLDDSAIEQAANEVVEREAQAAAAEKRQAHTVASQVKSEREAVRLEDIDELTGLTEEDLRAVLGKVAPDALLVVLATAGDALQRRILGNLSDESVAWLRANLAHMDEVRDAERDDARARVIKAANALLDDGTISVPEPESVNAEAAPATAEKELREVLTDLVRIGEQSGLEALEHLAETAGEPLLREGLRCVAGGMKGDELRRKMGETRAALEKRYALRLLMMEDALVAISEGETAEAFRAKLFAED